MISCPDLLSAFFLKGRFYINDDFYDQAYAASQYKTFSLLGLTSDSRIAVSLEDSAQWLTLCLYLKAIGASVMPLHPSLPKDSALKLFILFNSCNCDRLDTACLERIKRNGENPM